jgi:hypothetical protein
MVPAVKFRGVALGLTVATVLATGVACGGSTPPGQGVVRVGQDLFSMPCEPPDLSLNDYQRFPLGQSKVTWSGGDISLVGSGTTKALSASEQASLRLPVETDGLRDEHGDELLVACLEPSSPTGTGPVQAELRYVRDGAVRATHPLAELSDGFDGTTAIVAAQPEDHDLLLALTDLGGTTTLNLRTGDVTVESQPTASPAPPTTAAAPTTKAAGPIARGNDLFPAWLRMSGKQVGTDGTYDVMVNLDASASLWLTVDGEPAAKPGRAWLLIDISGSTQFADRVSVDLNLRDAFTITAGGRRVSVPDKSLFTQPASPQLAGGATIIADVPRNLRKVTVSFTFNGDITYRGKKVSYSSVIQRSYQKVIELS